MRRVKAHRPHNPIPRLFPIIHCSFITDVLKSLFCFCYMQLGHGDFSAANTKVLRMVNALGVDNEARQTIEALQSELQKANEKLKVVEELKKQSGKLRLVIANG